MAKKYIRSGGTTYGEIIANIDTETGDIRVGSTDMGAIIGRYDKSTGRIYAGDGALGSMPTWGSIDLDGMMRGGANPYGPIDAHICDESDQTLIRAGATSFGTILANITDF